MVSRRLLALERQLPSDSYPFPPSSTSTGAVHATLGSRVRRKSRNLIDHGTVFVFHQEGSNINRWTDGLTWSPSRIAGNFLMYKELLHKFPNDKCKTSEQKANARTGGTIQDPRVKEMVHREGLAVLGSAKGTFIEKNGGLIKKTITVQGLDIPPPEELQNWQLKRDVKNEQDYVFPRTGTFHLVCYERPGDTTPLITPSNDPKLRNLSLSRKFVTLQAFRNPMEIQPSDDDNQPWPLNEFVASSRIIEGRPPSKRHGCSQTRARRHVAARATGLRAVEDSDPYTVLVNMNICQSANHTDYQHDDKGTDGTIPQA
ncbi:hypothetical protein BGW42_008161 [Actinomortierella wolfii]|nr:hypothetical protein BGW42_008161 [Actinomortierella wolfii]